MNEHPAVFLLICLIVLLFAIIFYQQFIFTKGIQTNLKKISEKLSDILKDNSDEKIMVFTDNKILMNLCEQINCLLLDRQKIKLDYKRQELSSKKMLSNISHDIKTPLTVILGYLEILLLNNPENEDLQKVKAKAEQVMELINQFFTLAKLEAGDTDIEITKININELCKENVLDFYEILHRNGCKVELSIPEQPLYVQGNQDAISRILYNLLSNVLRYGSDGNYIGLFLREESHNICIDVVDKGKGIEKEFAETIFERLYTMEDSRNRKIQGSGLGLTIARHLAQQMGGEILLESEPNIRTVFTVKLKKCLYEK